MANIRKVRAEINKMKPRSAWNKGVQTTALELIDSMIECGYKDVPNQKAFLNGADSWKQYSEGGCSLVYNSDIAKRYCTKSELAKVRGGLYNPNSRENWIQLQTRALVQAYNLIKRTNEMME